MVERPIHYVPPMYQLQGGPSKCFPQLYQTQPFNMNRNVVYKTKGKTSEYLPSECETKGLATCNQTYRPDEYAQLSLLPNDFNLKPHKEPLGENQ